MKNLKTKFVFDVNFFVDNRNGECGDTCDPQTGPPVDKEQCKNGGWMRFDTPRLFNNQGDCIKFLNNGNNGDNLIAIIMQRSYISYL